MAPVTAIIREAIFPQDKIALFAVIHEYLAWLDMDLSHRGLDAEMAAFEQKFTLPSGMFFLAEAERRVAGCAGFLRHPNNQAEVKRLFVRPAFRGLNLGERLVRSVIDKAELLGFSKLILDAVPQTRFAIGLYQRMGFEEAEPFYANPVEGTRFFAMALPRSRG